MTGLDHDQMRELVAAHALDAVDPEEAAAVEAHVTSCHQCEVELASFREAIALVANSGGHAPSRPWEAIAAQIAQLGTSPTRHGAGPGVTVPPDPMQPPAMQSLDSEPGSTRPDMTPRATNHPNAGRRPRRLRTWALAAAAVVVLGALVVQLGRLEHEVRQLQAAGTGQNLAQAAQRALQDPRARRIVLTNAHATGPAVAEIAILPSGAGFLVNHGLPALAASETYQLWGQVGDELVSLGVLGAAPGSVAFHVDPTVPVVGFAITAERAGGVVRSTHVPVAVSRPGA